MGSLSSLSKLSAFRRSSRGFVVKDFCFLRKVSTAIEQVNDRWDCGSCPPRYGMHPSGFRSDSGTDGRGAPRESNGNALGRSFSGGNGNCVGGEGVDRLAVDFRYSRRVEGVPRDDAIGMSKDRNGFGRWSGDVEAGDCSVNLGQSTGEFEGNPSEISSYYGNGGWSPPSMYPPENVHHVKVSDRGANLQYGQPGDHCSPSRMYMQVDGKERPNTTRVSSQGPSSSVAYSTQSVGALENILGMSKHSAGVGHNPPSRFASEHLTSMKSSHDTGPLSHPVLGGVDPVDDPDENSEEAPLIGSLEELDAYCKDGKVKQAVEILSLLANKCVAVDLPRFVHLMKLCSDKEALQEAKSVHEHVSRAMFPIDAYLCNRILEMYASCGSVDNARALFDSMAERNLSTWDIMITCLAQNGHGEDAIDLFAQFRQAGMKPDGQLFISVFSVCTAVGDVFEGMLYFESMQKDFGIVPAMEHYMSMVEMLGSVGHLDEAFEFVMNIPIDPSIEIWEVLMNLCRVHGYIDMGDRCADMIEQLDLPRLTKESRSGLVPVKQSDIGEREPRQSSEKQTPSEVKRTMHEYRAGDRSHPETENIYALLRGLKGLMKEGGYIPETKFVLHDIDQESREEAILAHSEKLAVSYGLMTSPARASIRIIKNLRVCVDCHNAFKFISKITGRTIVMRDAKRFHHFEGGQCSCKDFW